MRDPSGRTHRRGRKTTDSKADPTKPGGVNMMAKPDFDVVVEAVHYDSNGQVAWIRAYERRGPIFSDREIIDRQSVIRRIKAGERFVVGRRIPYMANTFDVTSPLRVVRQNGNEVLVTGETGEASTDHDNLEGVPVL